MPRAFQLAMCVLLIGVTNTRADTLTRGGSKCVQHVTVPSGVLPVYGAWGIGNGDSSFVLPVVCPISWEGTDTSVSPNASSSFRVDYRDLSSAQDGSLSCGAVAFDAFDNYYYAASRHSCSTAGGCLTPTPSYVSGTGLTTNLLLPVFPQTIQLVTYTLRCYIPRPAPFISTINGYVVTYQP